MAPLQRRALYSLVIGVIFAVALIVVFVTRGGITTFHEDHGFRAIVYSLWIVGLAGNLLLMNFTLRKPVEFDERDRLIVERAQRIQLWAVIFSLVAWNIGLTEVYYEQGQIPVTFAFIIFMSILIVINLAQSAGILVSYWRGINND
ncbi:MAG: hypothetical protein JSW16_04360 [Dehalococcoidales bacterium]|nr:MAG: hypothetical protein JSW16_04360 [Dehalococcoidales bacterium]